MAVGLPCRSGLDMILLSENLANISWRPGEQEERTFTMAIDQVSVLYQTMDDES